MDQAALSILQTLLKTNRPPTDQETAIIRESMAPTNAELKSLEAHISETMARIEELESQVEQAESKLQRLREEEAAILETFDNHRRVFSPFRNIPEDILREICIAVVADSVPALSSRHQTIPLPYVLSQICSGMRHIALTTPIIWASMHVKIYPISFNSLAGYERAYSALVLKANTWFERAGGLGLTVSIEDHSDPYEMSAHSQSALWESLFDTLLSYSTRWKVLQIDTGNILSAPMVRIAALTAVEVPLLQSVSFSLDYVLSDPLLRHSVLLQIPTLRCVKLEICNMEMFTVDWANLTSVTLHPSPHSRNWIPKSDVKIILQQTKCLIFCDITVGLGGLEEHYTDNISLPFLKTLIVDERTFIPAKPGAPSILDLITAPILEIFDMRRQEFFDFADFFKRSTRISKLSLPYFDEDQSFTDTMRFLSHCPSLTELSLWPCKWSMDTSDADKFLRAFVESDAGVMCPCLQDFSIAGKIDFSFQTLRLFLEGRQGDIAAQNVMPWKKLVIDIRGIRDTEKRRQVSNLVSQKKAAGLNIREK
ncbi:hypothetical protein HYPSUDRAFT_44699 [Hypholoma sublateritium FD-334 SS-4]|uniref:F-box domain-containing protein n=1 Tax=Hypholoma sublateritium (strain FD-334 SS-4) TaxID=945553 RepID=A0A0D2PFZ6_HYPSF|nr:hypothetical protein HYPSUDRAFT_44699 [Hypholoma sublateritium FD-334 SS-4]